MGPRTSIWNLFSKQAGMKASLEGWAQGIPRRTDHVPAQPVHGPPYNPVLPCPPCSAPGIPRVMGTTGGSRVRDDLERSSLIQCPEKTAKGKRDPWPHSRCLPFSLLSCNMRGLDTHCGQTLGWPVGMQQQSRNKVPAHMKLIV